MTAERLLHWLDELMPGGQPYDECRRELSALLAELEELKANNERLRELIVVALDRERDA